MRERYPTRQPDAWRRSSRSRHLPTEGPTNGPGDATTSRLARLEAALWLADGPLAMRRLTKAAGLKGVAETRELLTELRGRLAGRRSALEVVEVAGGVSLMTRPQYAPWIESRGVLAAGSPERRLTRVATETLTIVAHRQPVLRSEVEAIRGVGCGEVLRQLLEADLLRIVGRSEELGRPLLYGTTERFLEVYGLGSLDDLPACDEGGAGLIPTKDNAAAEDAA